MRNVDMNDLIFIAREAGNAIMDIYQGNYDVEYKANDTPLTIADQSANDIIVQYLTEKYPEIMILSEESKDDPKRRTKDYLFIVDPLDGTKEFINQNGEFTVNIALVYQGRPIMGVIYAPVLGEMYYASFKQGAYIHSAHEEEAQRLSVSNKTQDLIMVGSKSHASKEERALMDEKQHLIQDTLTKGSSLKGCMVARGQADVYYRYGLTAEWDTAAMQCIAEESGAIVRQLDHTPLTYNREDTLNKKGFYIVNHPDNIWI